MKDEILRVSAKNIQIYGIKKFNLDSICKELKISKKTIYKYFDSKDKIIKEYIKEIIDTDKESTLKAVNEKVSLSEKCHKIIYTYHKYKLPISVMDEIKKYYDDEWNEIKALKEFKFKTILNLLEKAKNDGEINKEIDLAVITLIIEKVSEGLLDSDILRLNNLKLNYTIDQFLQAILNGILV